MFADLVTILRISMNASTSRYMSIMIYNKLINQVCDNNVMKNLPCWVAFTCITCLNLTTQCHLMSPSILLASSPIIYRSTFYINRGDKLSIRVWCFYLLWKNIQIICTVGVVYLIQQKILKYYRRILNLPISNLYLKSLLRKNNNYSISIAQIGNIALTFYGLVIRETRITRP